MMIYTRFGGKVTILGRCADNEGVHIEIDWGDGDPRRDTVPYYELRADGGIAEIQYTANDTPKITCAHQRA